MQTQTQTSDQDLIKLQIELEKLYNKNQLHRRLEREFSSSSLNFVEHMQANGIPIDFGMTVLIQISLHKRRDVPKMIGLVRHLAPNTQSAADMLMLCAESDLINYDNQARQFIVQWGISQDVQDELDRYQFPLPMVLEPRQLRENTDTGFLLGQGSVVLRGNHTRDDVNLDHLNRVNTIPFSIDFETAAMIKNQWKNLDKRKEGETPFEFNARKRAFEKYDRVAHDVMLKITEHDNRHFMTHRYDKRGRVYCQGYHVNYQGTSWNKAVVQLADKEMVD